MNINFIFGTEDRYQTENNVETAQLLLKTKNDTATSVEVRVGKEIEHVVVKFSKNKKKCVSINDSRTHIYNGDIDNDGDLYSTTLLKSSKTPREIATEAVNTMSPSKIKWSVW